MQLSLNVSYPPGLLHDSLLTFAVHNQMYKLDPPLTLDDFKHCKLLAPALSRAYVDGGGPS